MYLVENLPSNITPLTPFNALNIYESSSTYEIPVNDNRSKSPTSNPNSLPLSSPFASSTSASSNPISSSLEELISLYQNSSYSIQLNLLDNYTSNVYVTSLSWNHIILFLNLSLPHQDTNKKLNNIIKNSKNFYNSSNILVEKNTQAKNEIEREQFNVSDNNSGQIDLSQYDPKNKEKMLQAAQEAARAREYSDQIKSSAHKNGVTDNIGNNKLFNNISFFDFLKSKNLQVKFLNTFSYYLVFDKNFGFKIQNTSMDKEIVFHTVSQTEKNLDKDEKIDVFSTSRYESSPTFSSIKDFKGSNPLDPSFRGVDYYIRSHKQASILNMEDELNELTVRLAKEAELKQEADRRAADELAIKLRNALLYKNSKKNDEDNSEDENNDDDDDDDDEEITEDTLIEIGIKSATEDLINTLEEKAELKEFKMNQTEEYIQQTNKEYKEKQLENEELERLKREKEAEIVNNTELLSSTSITPSDQWKFLYHFGVKANFRDGKLLWQGHVSIKVYEDSCWHALEGMGNRYQFVVYDPNSSLNTASFVGLIQSPRHLKEVLGIYGQDLLSPLKKKEMILFIARYRMEIVAINEKNQNIIKSKVKAIENGPDAPLQSNSQSALEPLETANIHEEQKQEDTLTGFSIQFQRDRIYTEDKITPINANNDEDELVNSKKLMNIKNSRGTKIIRIIRRLSGLLMQLTVFELSKNYSENSLQNNPIEGVIIKGFSKVNKRNKELEEANASNNTNEIIPVLQDIPPSFRILGYDPRSKRKVSIIVEPQAVVEVAGGLYSPYLHIDKRKTLAKIICDSLSLYYPPTVSSSSASDLMNKLNNAASTAPFELVISWSGAKEGSISSSITSSSAHSSKSTSERVHKRTGRIYRAVNKIGNFEVILSIFILNKNPEDNNFKISRNPNDLIFNFYFPSISYGIDLLLSEQDQIARIEKPLLEFPEGTIRAAAIRHICKFFLIEKKKVENNIAKKEEMKESDESKQEHEATKESKVFSVKLLPTNLFYLNNYNEIQTNYIPGQDIRPVGIPQVFFPLDTCGNILFKGGKNLINFKENNTSREFLVIIYTKSSLEGPERGLVIKLYDRMDSLVSILHVGPSHLMTICAEEGLTSSEEQKSSALPSSAQPSLDEVLPIPHNWKGDLLQEIIDLKTLIDKESIDEVETKLSHFTLKGKYQNRYNSIVDKLVSIILDRLVFQLSPQNNVVPYFYKDGVPVYPN